MEIAKYYTNCFFDDCKKLGIRKPDVVTPATAHISTYIKMIEKLNEYDYVILLDDDHKILKRTLNEVGKNGEVFHVSSATM